MSENRSNLILGAIVGLLIGLGYCYWKQLSTVYQNRGLLETGGNVVSDVQSFVDQARGKL